jgi:urease accessory protein
MNAIARQIRARGEIRARFDGAGDRTHVATLYEAGGLRLKFPRRADGFEAILVNTAGGIVEGDHAQLDFAAGQGARATVTTQAAEKIYRSQGALARVDLSLSVAAGAHLEWLPQETILFDRAGLARRLDAEIAADASLTVLESLVFGRLGMGEVTDTGFLSDQWRVRRAGELVFAEALRLDGGIAAVLDRPAAGAGARMIATLLYVAPDAEARVDVLREAVPAEGVDCGISAWNGMIVARLASPSPERTRACIVALLAELRGAAAPRVWQT